MPKVWYPFPPDHEHAGKWYEGLAPDGNVEALQKIGGFRFDAPNPQDIVSPCDVVADELGALVDDFAAILADLSTMGKASLVTRYKRSVEAFKGQVAEAVNKGNATQGRLLLDRMERDVNEARKLLGGMTPWAAPQVAPPKQAQARSQ